MTLPRRCIDGGELIASGTRCAAHQAQRKRIRNADRPAAKAAVAHHLATVGPICPGWQRPAHQVDPAELTADHVVAIANGGRGFHAGDPAEVLCRSCNSSKGKR